MYTVAMPNSKNQQRRGSEDKNRKGRLSQKSSSFHGRAPTNMAAASAQELRRPKTVPDLLSFRRVPASVPEETTIASPAETQIRPQLTKLLLNVTIMGSLGAVQVITSPDSSVGDLIAAALRQYAKEGRRPILPSTDPAAFGLHYSQFSLQSLDRDEKLMVLGSRNFFLCPKTTAPEDGETTPSTCSKEAEKVGKIGFPWLKFMDFML